MNYTESHEYLDSLLIFGIKLGLENMQALCELLGNPQDDLKFIHVAGTNGKGSCCAMLAAALKKSNLKVGFYSSPFLYRFTERWRISGREVSEEQVSGAVTVIAELEPELMKITGVRPTYFEVLTAAALLIFKSAKVDVVVWETGMGGRLDATNVVMPLVSLITNIELDHTQYLGDTLEKIAAEKGGIIKGGVPLVCGEEREGLRKFFTDLATSKDSPIYLLDKDYCFSESGLEKKNGKFFRKLEYRSNQLEKLQIALPALGRHQCENASMVLKTLELVCPLLGINFESSVEGLSYYNWPGRLELRGNGLILDGAHNPDGAGVLVKALDEIYPANKFHFICGILADKNWKEVLDILCEKAESFYLVKIKNARASNPEELKDYILAKGVAVLGEGSAESALAHIEKPDKTVVVGSLYLIGEALSILNDGQPALIDSL